MSPSNYLCLVIVAAFGTPFFTATVALQARWSSKGHGALTPATPSSTLPLPQPAVDIEKASPIPFPATRANGDAAPTLRANGDAAPTLRVSGACDTLPDLNAEFAQQGVTADNRSYYQSKDGALYLYFDDKDCGDGSTPRWVFDASEPRKTATSDLDGTGTCSFAGYTDTSGTVPPDSAAWSLNCDGKSFTKVFLTIDWYPGWRVCPPGSFCSGEGCPSSSSNHGHTAVPQDRWDPDE
eukprot:gene18138-23657_t